MSFITIPAKSANETERAILCKLAEVLKQTKQRAYRLFEMRGNRHGQDLDDWLQAEQELLLQRPVEVHETPKEISVTISLPQFEAKDLSVEASP